MSDEHDFTVWYYLFTTTKYYKMTKDTQTSTYPPYCSPYQMPRLLRGPRDWSSLQLCPSQRVKTNATLPIAPSILFSQTLWISHLTKMSHPRSSEPFLPLRTTIIPDLPAGRLLSRESFHLPVTSPAKDISKPAVMETRDLGQMLKVADGT